MGWGGDGRFRESKQGAGWEGGRRVEGADVGSEAEWLARGRVGAVGGKSWVGVHGCRYPSRSEGWSGGVIKGGSA